jgi:hypothetical protein
MKHLEGQENGQSNGATNDNVKEPQRDDITKISPEETTKEEELLHQLHDHRAAFPDTPIRPSEKRKVYPFMPLF